MNVGYFRINTLDTLIIEVIISTFIYIFAYPQITRTPKHFKNNLQPLIPKFLQSAEKIER